MKPLVAICSLDAELYLLLAHILEVDGFNATLVGSAREMLELEQQKPIQAVLLDCRPNNRAVNEIIKLRRDARTGPPTCIALISHGTDHDHIELLKSGVEEVLVRPFAPSRLLDYLRSKCASADRPADSGAPETKLLEYGDIRMQVETHRVHCNGRELALGPIEFRLLRHMVRHPQKVISREELIEVAWSGRQHVSVRVVDVHISQLRKRLKQCSQTAAIRTVREAGYALELTSA